jgi:hypothetical protein
LLSWTESARRLSTVQAQSTNPLRFFLAKWATVVAIERWPTRAAAFHEAERLSGDPKASEQQFRDAMETTGRIRSA